MVDVVCGALTSDFLALSEQRGHTQGFEMMLQQHQTFRFDLLHPPRRFVWSFRSHVRSGISFGGESVHERKNSPGLVEVMSNDW